MLIYFVLNRKIESKKLKCTYDCYTPNTSDLGVKVASTNQNLAFLPCALIGAEV